MNWLKKGPELKMPSFGRSKKSDGDGGGGGGPKAPDFLSDLYYDLRERRLLPVILLVVVAIVAVPFLLGSSEEVTAPEAGAGATAGSSNANGATLAVVEANPGLRDPKKRLKGQTATDPFKQKFVGGGEEEEGAGSEATSTSVGESSEEPVPIEIENEEGESVTVRPAGSSGPVSPGGGSGGEPSGRFYGYRPNVRFGIQGSDQLKLYKELDNGARLPQKKPVAISLGVSSDGNKVLFGLTPEVILVKAEGVECVGGAQDCLFLSLKAGQAATLFTANPERTYRLSVDSIKFVEVDPPEPEKAGKSSAGPMQVDIAQSFSK